MRSEDSHEVTRMRAFGLRVAKLSPRLACGLVAGVVALWISLPGYAEFWLAEFVLGVAVSPLVIKLYKSGDVKYAMLYGAVIGAIGVPLHKMLVGSSGGPLMVAGIVPLLAGVASVIAVMKGHLVGALEDA